MQLDVYSKRLVCYVNEPFQDRHKESVTAAQLLRLAPRQRHIEHLGHSSYQPGGRQIHPHIGGSVLVGGLLLPITLPDAERPTAPACRSAGFDFIFIYPEPKLGVEWQGHAQY